jgi:hypothetical protein
MKLCQCKYKHSACSKTLLLHEFTLHLIRKDLDMKENTVKPV